MALPLASRRGRSVAAGYITFESHSGAGSYLMVRINWKMCHGAEAHYSETEPDCSFRQSVKELLPNARARR